MSNRPEYLCEGEPARLIPITADSAREQKSASVLLAGLRSVFELRQASPVPTQCQLLLKNDGVADEDQVFILNEILRDFESERACISNFDQMNAEWKDVINKFKSNAPLAKTSDEVQKTIDAWHQEQRDLCLIISRMTEHDVSLKLKNNHRLDTSKRVKDDATVFCKEPALEYALPSSTPLTLERHYS